MCERIYKQLSDQFITRMRNWAWTNSGAGQYVTSSMCAIVAGAGDRYPEARMPLLIGEAEDTGAALSRLPNRYKQAVSLFWQYEGRPLAWFARRCGEGVDWRTFEKRVFRGHELLKGEIARQHDRVERYQASIRALAIER